MRAPSYPEFPIEEYHSRCDRLRDEMEERGLDAVLLTTETNHRYFDAFNAKVFGLQHYYFFSVLPRDKSLPPVFMCSHGFDQIVTTTWFPEIRLWDVSSATST